MPRTYGPLNVNADAFTANKPVSALQTFLLRNNIQHIIDASPNYKINWGTSTSTDEFGNAAQGTFNSETLVGSRATAGAFEYAFVFPLTIIELRKGPLFDLRIGIRTVSTNDATVRYTLRAANGGPPLYTSEIDITTGATPAWYDDPFEPTSDRSWLSTRFRVNYADPATGDETSTPDTFTLAMLSIYTIPDNAGVDPADAVQLVGVTLREYFDL